MPNYYLCYKSELAPKVKEEDIMQILSTAQKFNLKNNITGMLLFIDGHFIQFLEGDKETISNLYKKIITDHRHYGVKTLSEGAISSRSFPNWVMGFRVLNEQDIRDMAEMNGLKEFSVEQMLNGAHAHIAIELMKSFYKNGELDFYKFWKE